MAIVWINTLSIAFFQAYSPRISFENSVDKNETSEWTLSSIMSLVGSPVSTKVLAFSRNLCIGENDVCFFE